MQLENPDMSMAEIVDGMKADAGDIANHDPLADLL